MHASSAGKLLFTEDHRGTAELFRRTVPKGEKALETPTRGAGQCGNRVVLKTDSTTPRIAGKESNDAPSPILPAKRDIEQVSGGNPKTGSKKAKGAEGPKDEELRGLHAAEDELFLEGSNVPGRAMFCPQALDKVLYIMKALEEMPSANIRPALAEPLYKLLEGIGKARSIGRGPAETSRAYAIKVGNRIHRMAAWYQKNFEPDTMVGFGPAPADNSGAEYTTLAPQNIAPGFPFIGLKFVRNELQIMRGLIRDSKIPCPKPEDVFNLAIKILQEGQYAVFTKETLALYRPWAGKSFMNTNKARAQDLALVTAFAAAKFPAPPIMAVPMELSDPKTDQTGHSSDRDESAERDESKPRTSATDETGTQEAAGAQTLSLGSSTESKHGKDPENKETSDPAGEIRSPGETVVHGTDIAPTEDNNVGTLAEKYPTSMVNEYEAKLLDHVMTQLLANLHLRLKNVSAPPIVDSLGKVREIIPRMQRFIRCLEDDYPFPECDEENHCPQDNGFIQRILDRDGGPHLYSAHEYLSGLHHIATCYLESFAPLLLKYLPEGERQEAWRLFMTGGRNMRPGHVLLIEEFFCIRAGLRLRPSAKNNSTVRGLRPKPDEKRYWLSVTEKPAEGSSSTYSGSDAGDSGSDDEEKEPVETAETKLGEVTKLREVTAKQDEVDHSGPSTEPPLLNEITEIIFKNMRDAYRDIAAAPEITTLTEVETIRDTTQKYLFSDLENRPKLHVQHPETIPQDNSIIESLIKASRVSGKLPVSERHTPNEYVAVLHHIARRRSEYIRATIFPGLTLPQQDNAWDILTDDRNGGQMKPCHVVLAEYLFNTKIICIDSITGNEVELTWGLRAAPGVTASNVTFKPAAIPPTKSRTTTGPHARRVAPVITDALQKSFQQHDGCDNHYPREIVTEAECRDEYAANSMRARIVLFTMEFAKSHSTRAVFKTDVSFRGGDNQLRQATTAAIRTLHKKFKKLKCIMEPFFEGLPSVCTWKSDMPKKLEYQPLEELVRLMEEGEFNKLSDLWNRLRVLFQIHLAVRAVDGSPRAKASIANTYVLLRQLHARIKEAVEGGSNTPTSSTSSAEPPPKKAKA